MTFADLDKDGNITVSHTNPLETEIIQENHYYPFGMQHDQPTTQTGTKNDYTYNGKELNDDFDLNLHDYGARWYDASIGRWHSIDPLAEKYNSMSPYNYVANNPLKFIDPDGRSIEPPLIYFNKSVFRDQQFYDYAMQDKTDKKGLITIYAHGNYQRFNVWDSEGTVNKIRTVEQFDEFMTNNSEDWLDYKENGSNTTCYLFSCNVGGEFYNGDEKGKKVTPFMEKLSKAYPNVNFMGFDGYAMVSGKYLDKNKNGKRDKSESVVEGSVKFRGVSKKNGDKIGKLVYYKNGKILHSRAMNNKKTKDVRITIKLTEKDTGDEITK